MKTKPLRSIIIISAIALCIFVLRPRSEPQEQSTKDVDHTVIAKDKAQPLHKKVAPSRHQVEKVVFTEEKEILPENPDDAFYLEEENVPPPEPEHTEPQTRDSLIVEPPPEFDDETRFVESVDVMEVELTGMLLDVDMPDEKIDDIFDKIRTGPENSVADDGLPQDYLKRLKVVAQLIRQSDMNSYQLAMIIDDIFDHRGASVQGAEDTTDMPKAGT